MVADMPNKTNDNDCVDSAAAGVTMGPQELIALGKRHSLLDEHSTAVEYFANACQQLASKHGDMAKECAPAYKLYGQSLLEMARQNMGIVEPESAKAKGETEDKKTEGETSGEKMDAITEEAENDKEEKEDNAEDSKDDEEEEEENKETEEGDESNEENKDGEEENEEGQDEENEEEEDEADSNLKLAWTFLDLAKVIYLKEKKVDDDRAAADCLMALGEVSMEGGNVEAGAKDMREAIHLRRLHSGRVDRIVAASEYELGAALSQFQQYEESLTSLKECLSILTELNDKVNQKLKETTDKEEEDNLQVSIKEFAELMADVKDKISEVEEEQSMRDVVKNELTEKAKAALESIVGNENSETAAAIATGEVKTLTARRKPTATDAAPSPNRIASALVSSLKAADSPMTKSRVADLISKQMKRHRLETPGATDSLPVKRPASACSNENEGADNETSEEVTSKRIRADEPAPDAIANNN